MKLMIINQKHFLFLRVHPNDTMASCLYELNHTTIETLNEVKNELKDELMNGTSNEIELESVPGTGKNHH